MKCSSRRLVICIVISCIFASTFLQDVKATSPSYSFSVETSDEYNSITISFTGHWISHAEIYFEGELLKNATNNEQYVKSIYPSRSGDFEVILLVYDENSTLYSEEDFTASLAEDPSQPFLLNNIPDVWIIFVLIILLTFGLTASIMAGPQYKRARGQRASYTKK